MFMYGQGFSKEISEIKFTWYEPHVELQLTGAVADPIVGVAQRACSIVTSRFFLMQGPLLEP
jgi:hypothetical protein